MQENITYPGMPTVPRANEWGSFPRSGRGWTLARNSPFSILSGFITVCVRHPNRHTHSLPTAYFVFLLFVTLWIKRNRISQKIFLQKSDYKIQHNNLFLYSLDAFELSQWWHAVWWVGTPWLQNFLWIISDIFEMSTNAQHEC